MNRLKSIDCLRGAAALAVLVVHAAHYRIAPSHPSLPFRLVFAVMAQGALGVPLFFVISGFCIHLRWAKQFAATGSPALDFAPFWKRRLRRLYPPYVVMLCASMLLVLAAYVLHRDVPTLGAYPEPKLRWMGLDFAAHLFMLHGLHPVFDQGGGNGVYWTLAREEYFYLMYFGLIAFRRRWGVTSAVVATLVVGLAFPLAFRWLTAADARWWPIIYNSAVVLWIQWSLGMLAAEAYVGLVQLPRFCFRPEFALLSCVGAWLSERHCPALAPAAWGAVFFIILNGCVSAEMRGRWKSSGWTHWLAGVGVFSYSLYLVHNPARMVVNQLLHSVPTENNQTLFVILAVGIACAGYWLAKGYFMLVERRFMSASAAGAPSGKVP